MSREQHPGGPFDERFTTLRAVQEGLERLGYFLYPVPKEHTEAGITDPLVHRIKMQVKKRGMEKVAGRVAVTFSGWAQDRREVFDIPEVRGYWRALDRQLPELPALLAYLPELAFNGPGIHLMLVGDVDLAIKRPELGGYDVSVVDANPIVDDALKRIRQAGTQYHLRPITTNRLLSQFIAGATHQLRPL